MAAIATGQEPTPSSQRMITSLDLGGKKWAKLSQRGRAAMSSIANARSQLDFVGSGANWGALEGCSAVREQVEASLLSSRCTRSAELQVVLEELEAAVRAMRAAVDDHRGRVEKAAAARSDARRVDRSTAPLIARAYEAVATFERELLLRQDIAREIELPAERLCAALLGEKSQAYWRIESTRDGLPSPPTCLPRHTTRAAQDTRAGRGA